MWRTRDGYAITVPRFRVRRLSRRLRTQRQNHPRQRAAAKLLAHVLRRARRAPSGSTRYPVFTSNVGGRALVVVTRAIAPLCVELLYVGHGRRP